MIKKILFMLVCLALVLSASSSAALAGNGVPPVVLKPKDGGECEMPWIEWRQDRTVWVPTVITGIGSFVYQPTTGFWTLTCRFSINFDNPMTATIEEACAISESILPDIVDCKNNAFVATGLDCWLYDMVTTDSKTIVNSSGVGLSTCQFTP